VEYDCQPKEGCVECPLWLGWKKPDRPRGFEGIKIVDSPLEFLYVEAHYCLDIFREKGV